VPWPFTTAPVPEPDAGITKDAVGEPDMPGTTADPDLGSLIRTAGSTIDPLGWLAARPAGPARTGGLAPHRSGVLRKGRAVHQMARELITAQAGYSKLMRSDSSAPKGRRSSVRRASVQARDLRRRKSSIGKRPGISPRTDSAGSSVAP